MSFLGGAYAGRSESVNAERCLNFFLEKQGDDWTLVGTPGLTLRLTHPTGPHRGAHYFEAIDRVITVSGSSAYAVDRNHNATLLGTIGTVSGRVSMDDNGLQLVLVDGSSVGYYYDGTTFATIDDEDFNGGVMVTEQDGYFLVCEPGTGRFRISDLNTATTWIDTDFATAEGLPDNLRGIISDHREIWLPGSRSMEVFYDSGDPDFPFTRNENGFIERGIAAGFTLAQHDNSLNWLSEDERGKGLLLTADGNYRPTVISPTGINWQWAQYSRIDDAFAFTYQIEGHEFYVITFPTANRTWVLDAATKQWHQWSSNLDSNELSRHRASSHVFAWGRHYVGDYASGKLYTLEPNVYTEDGATIIRDRIGQHLPTEEEWLPIAAIQMGFEEGAGLETGQGSDPQAMLRWSKDGGRTWSNELWKSVGKAGEYNRRAIWRKPGTSRNWAFWLRVSDPIKWVVREALIKIRDDGSSAKAA